MESIKEESERIVETPMNFFSYVFNFKKDSRDEMLNMLQYCFLAIILVALFNKGLQKLIPSADDEKGSPIILAEVFIQIFLLFLGMLFIHRIIAFIPTISKTKYGPFNPFTLILPVIVILFDLGSRSMSSQQSKSGDKVSIVMDRLFGDGAEEQSSKSSKSSGKKNVNVSQPISGQSSPMNLLPQGINTTQNPMGGQSSIPGVQSPIPDPDFNSMFAGPNMSMPGAATPGMEEFVPIAANAVLPGF